MMDYTSFQIFTEKNENYDPNIYEVPSIMNNDNFGIIKHFPTSYTKTNLQKKISGAILTERNYQYRNYEPFLNHIPRTPHNIKNYENYFTNNSKIEFDSNNDINFYYNFGIQRNYSSKNINEVNYPYYILPQNKKNHIKEMGTLKCCNTNFGNQNKSKIPHPKYGKKNYQNKLLDRCNKISYLNDNYNSIYSNEPQSNFKLSDFTIIQKISEGSEGSINTVRWNKNNKMYVLKKSEIIHDEDLPKKKGENALIKELSKNCEGIIRTYGDLSEKNHFGTIYYYELMEFAEKNWEKEIIERGKNNYYYQEHELMRIFQHLIKAFSLLQSRNFTHRDIKPENIMISKGNYKICDFGNAKIISGDGTLVNKIRGSELFMSPIVFKAFHSGMDTVRHNTYKSDVFSLGLCFFLAASLTYSGLNIIREIYNMNSIQKIVNKYLSKRYSQKLINLLLNMLQVDENSRPDFMQLEIMFI